MLTNSYYLGDVMETMWHRPQGSVNLTVFNSICACSDQKRAGTAAKL